MSFKFFYLKQIVGIMRYTTGGIRLKDNLILQHDGGEITTGEAAKAGMTSLLNATRRDHAYQRPA